MARERKPPKPSGEVPAWFMTYSDTVTLLMTFFILLLTFASSEPEQFEKMKITLFGPGGSTGFASPMPKGLEKDSFVARVRPKAARLVMEGSEMPPTQKDASTESLSKELAGLEEEQTRDLVDEYRIKVELNEFASSAGEIFPFGKQHLSMISKQLGNLPFEAVFEVNDEANLDRAIACNMFLSSQGRIAPGKLAVSWNPDSQANRNQMVIIIRRHRRTL